MKRETNNGDYPINSTCQLANSSLLYFASFIFLVVIIESQHKRDGGKESTEMDPARQSVHRRATNRVDHQRRKRECNWESIVICWNETMNKKPAKNIERTLAFSTRKYNKSREINQWFFWVSLILLSYALLTSPHSLLLPSLPTD